MTNVTDLGKQIQRRTRLCNRRNIHGGSSAAHLTLSTRVCRQSPLFGVGDGGLMEVDDCGVQRHDHEDNVRIRDRGVWEVQAFGNGCEDLSDALIKFVMPSPEVVGQIRLGPCLVCVIKVLHAATPQDGCNRYPSKRRNCVDGRRYQDVVEEGVLG